MGNGSYKANRNFEAELTKQWQALVAEVHRTHSGEPVTDVETALDRAFRRAGMSLDGKARNALAEQISNGYLPNP